MKHFPDFMKNPQNKIDISQQHTDDIEGYYYEGADGSQIAFWECRSDRISEKHRHDFDEYMICVSGQYTAYVDDKEIALKPGDEILVPKGTQHWGRYTAGTRTIFVFGGKRIQNPNDRR